MKTSRSAFAQQGVTLVELMVSIAIGVVVTLAITTAYIGGKQTQQGQSDLARLEEAGRVAIQLISNEVSRAGYRNLYENTTLNAKEFGAGGNRKYRVEGTDDTPGDTLIVRYYGDAAFGATVDSPDNHTLDCQGNPLGRTTLTENTLSLQTDENESWLSCGVDHIDSSGADSTMCDPASTTDHHCRLVPGVEAMQFLFGIDPDRNGWVKFYVPASNMTPVYYSRVISVRVGLVVRSITIGDTGTSTQTTDISNVDPPTYKLFGTSYSNTADVGSVFTPTKDGRLRRAFTGEVYLRNPEIN
jgi:type IV pilus assembly protein PilW